MADVIDDSEMFMPWEKIKPGVVLGCMKKKDRKRDKPEPPNK